MSLNMRCSQVEEYLYLANELIACDKKFIRELQIKKILTILSRPLPESKKISGIYYKYIRADDDDNEDLITYFPECYQFIYEGQAYGENVLVHCHAGISRSSTVVIAYLMQKYKISATNALNKVFQSRICINPNSGFRQQLFLWDKMSYRLDANNCTYRKIIFVCLKSRIVETLSERNLNILFSHYLNAFGEYFHKIIIAEGNDQLLNRGKAYYCVKCDNQLFNEINVFKSDAKIGCLSIYIEPIKWIIDDIEKNSKDLSDLEAASIRCSKCLQQLGTFDWTQNDEHPCNCQLHREFNYFSVIKITSNKVKTSTALIV